MKIQLVIISMMLTVMASSCDRKEIQIAEQRFETMDKLDRSKTAHLGDFLKLYPQASVTHVYFSPTGEPGFNVATTLYDRYQLNMQLPVSFSADNKRVTKIGEPRFNLLEITKITPVDGHLHSIDYGTTQHEFGPKEWTKVVNAGGNFKAIGYELSKTKPVANIKYLKDADALRHRPAK